MDQSPDIQVDQTPTANSSLPTESLPQVQPPTPEQVTGQKQADTQAFHQGPMGSVLHSILGALGGSTQTTYQVDPKSGSVTQNTTPATPGSQWKTILAGALTGLAAGAQVHGPGGMGAAAGAGVQAGQQAVRQQQQQQQQQAENQGAQIEHNNQSQSQAKLAQASFALQQQNIAKNTLDIAGKKVALTEAQVKDNEEFSQRVASTPGAEYQGFFKTRQDVAKASQQNPQLLKDHAAGTQVVHPVVGQDENGSPTVEGFEVYNLPKQWLDSPTDHDTNYVERKIDPTTGKEQITNHTIPKGSVSNAFAIQLGQKDIAGAVAPKQEESEDAKAAVAASNNQTKLMVTSMKAVADAVKASKAHEPLDPRAVDATADMIANYQVDPATMRYMLKEHPELLASAHEKNPNFSQMNYDAGKKALESFSSGGKNNQQMISAQASIQHASTLAQLVSKLPTTTNVNVLNRAIAATARQLGMQNITNVDTLVDVLSGEMGKSITGGVPDKETLAEMRNNLKAGKRSIPQIQGAIKVLVKANAEKLDGLAQTLEQVPNIEKNPYAPKLSPDTVKALQGFGESNPFDFQARAAKASGQSNGPAVGTVQQGYRFKGGNPADQNSWEKVQ